MSKEAQLKFRIDDYDYDMLRMLAQDDKRKIVDYVRIVLHEHVKNNRPKQRVR